MSVEEQLRIAIGTGLIQSNYLDQDPETGTVDALQSHPCEGCEMKRCPCSGVPYLSQAIWDAADKFGDLTKALATSRSEGVADGWRQAMAAARDAVLNLSEHESMHAGEGFGPDHCLGCRWRFAVVDALASLTPTTEEDRA